MINVELRKAGREIKNQGMNWVEKPKGEFNSLNRRHMASPSSFFLIS